jgi:hypothetical protein
MASLSAIPVSAPFVIRFEDSRCIGGIQDREFATEEDARDGWANIKRKHSRTNAELWINGTREGTHFHR